MISILINFILRLPLIVYYYFKDKKQSKDDIKLYGIYGYFGLPGKGKTMCMCRELQNLRKKYGDKIYICTNFAYKDEDFAFKFWEQLLQTYDKPLVVAWDEVQNEFNSRNFKSFPIELLTELTQVRKENGVQILYTSQRWHFLDKIFRSLSFGCYQCGTFFGRFTFARLFDPQDYDQLCNSVSVDRKMKIHPKSTISFMQTDDLRNSYDSYKKLRTALSKV